MAIHLPTGSDYLSRTSNIVQPNTNYTCIFWTRDIADAFSNCTLFIQLDDPGIYTNYIGIYGTSGIDLSVPSGTTSPYAGLQNTWYPITYVRNGSTHSLYISGVFIGSETDNLSAATFSFQFLGNDAFSPGNLDFYNFREWNVALNLTQINAEINSPSSVVHSSGLVTFTPLTSDLLDVSGNGNNWTAVGSPTFVADPISPTNISPTTATQITIFPYTNVQNVLLDTYDFTVWYKFTAPSTGFVSAFQFGDLSVYEPSITIYLADAITVVVSNSNNRPVQFLTTSGLVYYIKITPNSGNPSPASLTLNVQLFAPGTINQFAILVNNDHVGGDFPAAIYNPDGSLVSLRTDLAAGEAGDILTNGKFLLSDEAVDHNCKLYNADLSFATNVVCNSPDTPVIRTHVPTDKFYMVEQDANPVKVYTVDSTGARTLVESITVAADIVGIAVNVAETILYYVLKQTGGAIKRWDLVGHIAMSDLVAGVANYLPRDLLILADDTVIRLMTDTLATDVKIQNVSAAGSVLHTYDFANTANTEGRLARSSNNSTSFWAWMHPISGINLSEKFVEIKVSDGTALNTLNEAQYEQGQYKGVISSNPARFGNSNSCPFFLLQAGGTIIVGKASGPVNSETFTINVTGPTNKTFTIGFQGTESLSLVSGTYSIVEVLDPLYQPQYNTSNGDPNTAIVVNNGDLIDLVIVNQLSAKYGGLYQLVPGKTNDTLRNQDGSTTDKIINWFFELFTDRDK